MCTRVIRTSPIVEPNTRVHTSHSVFTHSPCIQLSIPKLFHTGCFLWTTAVFRLKHKHRKILVFFYMYADSKHMEISIITVGNCIIFVNAPSVIVCFIWSSASELNRWVSTSSDCFSSSESRVEINCFGVTRFPTIVSAPVCLHGHHTLILVRMTLIIFFLVTKLFYFIIKMGHGPFFVSLTFIILSKVFSWTVDNVLNF